MQYEKPEFEAHSNPVPEEFAIVDWAERERTALSYNRLASAPTRAESLHALADLLEHDPDNSDMQRVAKQIKRREMWVLAICESERSADTLTALGRLHEVRTLSATILALIADVPTRPQA